MSATYGLRPEHIIAAYPGTIEDDFAAGGLCGTDVIAREIGLQAAILDAQLPARLRRRLSAIRFLRVVPDEDGVFTLPIAPDDPTNLTVFADADPQGKCDAPCDLDAWYKCQTQWPVLYLPPEANPYGDLPARWQVGPGLGPILVSYAIADDAPILTMQALLRDLVACAMGRRLYTAAEGSDWTLVGYYCDGAAALLSLMVATWIPPELQRLPIAFAEAEITSYRVIRSS